jgi:hypothetical protein
MNDGDWHHMVFTYEYSDDSAKVYVDGVLRDKDEVGGKIAWDAANQLTIGSRKLQYYLQGKIDEVGFWRGVELTQDNVDSLYNSNNGKRYPFSSDVDSIQIQLIGFDTELDSVRINYRYDSIPTSIFDNILLAAFDETDTTAWNDTTLLWEGLPDTTIYIAVWCGKNGSWTIKPNKDSIGLWIADTANVFDASFTHLDVANELADELLAYYSLEEITGNAVDSVGNYNLPLSGGVTQQETGVVGDCYAFATDGYLGYQDLNNFDFSGSFSLSCWINTTSTSSWSSVAANFGPSNYGWELVDVGDPRKIYWRLRHPPDNTTIISSTTINDGFWHHIAASYNATDDTMKLWIDGELEGTTYCAGPVYSSNCYLTIGSRLAGAYFNGYIDEVGFWDGTEFSEDEVDSLYNAGAGQAYPFTVGEDADSIRIQISGFDAQADSHVVNYAYNTYPTSPVHGTRLFVFARADTGSYNDTTFEWAGHQDTIVYMALWSREAGAWVGVPNKDTVLVGTSTTHISPSGHNVYFHWDGENHTGLPKRYTTEEWYPEWNPKYPERSSDHRYGGWEDVCPDSIVVDNLTGSKVLKFSHKDTIIYGNCAEGSHTTGDSWKSYTGGDYTELYISFNVMFKPGFLWSGGGKIGPGPAGGTEFPHGQGPEIPGYGDGFDAGLIWDWYDIDAGAVCWYLYHQDIRGEVGDLVYWDDFQPEGTGLTGNYNAYGRFVIPANDYKWINFTTRCVVNTHNGTTPVRNGILEGYVNGKLVGQRTGLYLITYPDINNNLTWWKLYQFFGGGGCALRDEWVYWDDVVLWTYDEDVDVPRGNQPAPEGTVLTLPPECNIEKIDY